MISIRLHVGTVNGASMMEMMDTIQEHVDKGGQCSDLLLQILIMACIFFCLCCSVMPCSNPSLRVAYIDEVEERRKDKTEKVYYSVLVKAVNNLDQEIYRIRLPGPVRLGEGKPENQNHAIIFTRGEGLQAIDMNQVSS
jgi:hypothetical protein